MSVRHKSSKPRTKKSEHKMTDIKLNDKTWDIFVTDGGDMILIHGIEALKQRLRIKLQHFHGEWFADTTSGIMRYSMFGEKNPDLDAIESYMKQEIESDEDVTEVSKITAKFNPGARTIYISFTASTKYGEINQQGVNR